MATMNIKIENMKRLSQILSKKATKGKNKVQNIQTTSKDIKIAIIQEIIFFIIIISLFVSILNTKINKITCIILNF